MARRETNKAQALAELRRIEAGERPETERLIARFFECKRLMHASKVVGAAAHRGLQRGNLSPLLAPPGWLPPVA